MEERTISIIGLGFLGSHVSEELAKLCFSQDLFDIRFRLIDFDTWEERNAANQNVSLEIAKTQEHKVITCARYIESYNFKAEPIKEKLLPENAKDLLQDSHLIIDCLDNIPTRQLLWGLGIGNAPCPVLHSGISRKGEGIINWSSKEFDTFPFKPQYIAGRNLKNMDIKKLPCELFKYRIAGLVLVGAITKATSIYLKKDPWGVLQGTEEEGMMTCWNTSEKEAVLCTDPEYLIQDDYFPIHSDV